MAHNESEVTYSYKEASKAVLLNQDLVFLSEDGYTTIQSVAGIMSLVLSIGSGSDHVAQRYRLIKTGISII